MSKKIKVEIELGGVINSRVHDLDDFVEDLTWTIKEYIDLRIEGFSKWNKGAITGLHDRKSFLWANSVVDALEKARDGVHIAVEDIEHTEVQS